MYFSSSTIFSCLSNSVIPHSYIFPLFYHSCCCAVSQPAVICILYSLPDTTAILNSVGQDLQKNYSRMSEFFRRLEPRLFNAADIVIPFPKKCPLPEHHLLMSCSVSPVAHPFTLCLHFFFPVTVVPPAAAGGGEKRRWGVEHLYVCSQ